MKLSCLHMLNGKDAAVKFVDNSNMLADAAERSTCVGIVSLHRDVCVYPCRGSRALESLAVCGVSSGVAAGAGDDTSSCSCVEGNPVRWHWQRRLDAVVRFVCFGHAAV